MSSLQDGSLSTIDSVSDLGPPETSGNAVPIESVQMLRPQVERSTTDELSNPAPDSAVELSSVTFLRSQRVDSEPRNPLIRAVLTILSIALLLGVAGQIVLHERDRIVAQYPGLRPWLLVICTPLNCQLSALKDKNSIVIDSATFNKIAGDSYRLNFTLKNTSTVALAAPAIELRLTDSQDQAVLRRVFLNTELDLKSDTLAANSERVISLSMLLNPTSAAQQIVGYRLYAFYP
jgi:hypothetical protein